MIKVRYSSVDNRNGKWRAFKTLKGARKFAQHWIGKNPEMGSTYAVSGDGIGKIEAEGIELHKLFGDEPGELPEGEFKIYIVHPVGNWFRDRAEAEALVKACIEYDPQSAYGPYEIQESMISKDDLS